MKPPGGHWKTVMAVGRLRKALTDHVGCWWSQKVYGASLWSMEESDGCWKALKDSERKALTDHVGCWWSSKVYGES